MAPENGIITIGEYTYLIVDERPKLNDWYINMFATSNARSVQRHTHIRHIINHKKDYRWRYCYKIIKCNDPKVNH